MAVPVPLRAMVCEPLDVLSVMVTVADLAPLVVGVKVRLMLQVAPPATVEPQVLVWLNELLSVPLRAMLVMLSDTVLVLVRVTVWVALVLLICWLPKATAEDDSVTVGVLVPVPVRLTV